MPCDCADDGLLFWSGSTTDTPILQAAASLLLIDDTHDSSCPTISRGRLAIAECQSISSAENQHHNVALCSFVDIDVMRHFDTMAREQGAFRAHRQAQRP